MKYLLFFCAFIFVFPFCSRDFKVIEASKQKWSGGIPDAGKGTNYVVKMLAKTDHEKLYIDQLWIGEDFYKVQAYKQKQNRRDTLFVKNDTIWIKATKLLQPNRKGVMVEKKAYENKEKPIDSESEALIGYILKGKRKYKEIESLKELKFIPYP